MQTKETTESWIWRTLSYCFMELSPFCLALYLTYKNISFFVLEDNTMNTCTH